MWISICHKSGLFGVLLLDSLGPAHYRHRIDACFDPVRLAKAEVRSRKPDRRDSIEVKAAGPVSRILSAGLLLRDGHSSGLRITA
jgi:hypothetical protein